MQSKCGNILHEYLYDYIAFTELKMGLGYYRYYIGNKTRSNLYRTCTSHVTDITKTWNDNFILNNFYNV